jgi:hypothetical protein
MVANKVSDLTIDEFRDLIRETVKQTLAELLFDPDEGLELRADVEKALLRSMKSVREGGETYSAEDTARELGLDW